MRRPPQERQGCDLEMAGGRSRGCARCRWRHGVHGARRKEWRSIRRAVAVAALPPCRARQLPELAASPMLRGVRPAYVSSTSRARARRPHCDTDAGRVGGGRCPHRWPRTARGTCATRWTPCRASAVPSSTSPTRRTGPGWRSCWGPPTFSSRATAPVPWLGSASTLELSPTRHPHLNVITLSAWGPSGPWADQARLRLGGAVPRGISQVEGTGDRPGALPSRVLDHAMGYLAAAASMLAVASVQRGGSPRSVQLSLAQTARWLLGAGTTSRADRHGSADVDAYRVVLPGAVAPVDVVRPPGRLVDLEPSWSFTTDLGADAPEFPVARALSPGQRSTPFARSSPCHRVANEKACVTLSACLTCGNWRPDGRANSMRRLLPTTAIAPSTPRRSSRTSSNWVGCARGARRSRSELEPASALRRSWSSGSGSSPSSRRRG